jgi:hypothetical protein
MGTHCAYEGMVSIGSDGTHLFWGHRGSLPAGPTRLNTAIAAAMPQPIGLHDDPASTDRRRSKGPAVLIRWCVFLNLSRNP